MSRKEKLEAMKSSMTEAIKKRRGQESVNEENQENEVI